VDSAGEIVGHKIVGVYVNSFNKIDANANEKRLRDEINSILNGNKGIGFDDAGNYDTAVPTNHTVTFDSDGGSSVTAQAVANGDKVVKPADPTKSGFTFEGWYKEPALTNLWDFGTDTVTSDITLYAKWTPVGGGGSEDAAEIVETAYEDFGNGLETATNPEQADSSDAPAGLDEFAVDEGGKLYADTEAVIAAIDDAQLADAIDSADAAIPLPVFEAEVTATGKTGIVTIKTKFDQHDGRDASDLMLIKLAKNGKSVTFDRLYTVDGMKDGAFVVTDEDKKVIEGKLQAGVYYHVSVGIKDNGAYDWDTDNGKIIDPAVLTMKKVSTPGGGSGGGGSGGGGCSTGAAWIGALALAGLAALKKRRRLLALLR
jgi:uncharacterized repeat protein (TIGR02543 family)